MFRNRQAPDAVDRPKPILRCSFRNKLQDDVRKLIAGPSVFICDECVEVCNDIIADDARFEASARLREGLESKVSPEVKEGAESKHIMGVPLSGPAVRCALCRMPAPIADGILIANRGVLCPGCVGEIEATVAERRQQGS